MTLLVHLLMTLLSYCVTTASGSFCSTFRSAFEAVTVEAVNAQTFLVTRSTGSASILNQAAQLQTLG